MKIARTQITRFALLLAEHAEIGNALAKLESRGQITAALSVENGEDFISIDICKATAIKVLTEQRNEIESHLARDGVEIAG